jgi:pimeloyl-ACP methyl ester carboxylesterase
METFVLVHPAWFGGWCWGRTIPLLRATGRDAFAPTLTGLGERAHLARPDVGLATHVDDVVSFLNCEDLSEVALVGSSSSGAVITGVAHRVPERISRIVYLDAFVPQDGQAVFDLIAPERRAAMQGLVEAEGDGWRLPRFAPPPWRTFVPDAWRVTDEDDLRWVLARLVPTPFRHFTEPVRASNPRAAQLPRAFVRCTGWPHALFDRHAQTARQLGWQCLELATPHLPYITHPRELAATLLELVAA